MNALLAKLIAMYAKMSKRERWALYAMILVVGGLAIDRLVVGPVLDRVAFLGNEIKTQEAAIQKSLHVLLRKDQIEAEGKQLAAYAVDSTLSEENEMTALLKELEKMANQAAANVLYVKPGTIEAAGSTKRYIASMECEAEMAEIVNFLHAIENAKKLFRIEKYEIQPKSKDTSIARCTMVVSKTVLTSV